MRGLTKDTQHSTTTFVLSAHKRTECISGRISGIILYLQGLQGEHIGIVHVFQFFHFGLTFNDTKYCTRKSYNFFDWVCFN